MASVSASNGELILDSDEEDLVTSTICEVLGRHGLRGKFSGQTVIQRCGKDQLALYLTVHDQQFFIVRLDFEEGTSHCH
jgi:hypothetical protein